VQGFRGKPEGKRPLERPRRRWEDAIKMDLRAIGWGGAEWIHLTQGSLAGCCECGDEPSGSGARVSEFLTPNNSASCFVWV
jgi:hypothetical protein